MNDDENALARVLRAPAAKWADKLATAFGHVGAIAPTSLSVAVALGEATHTSALALLPTLLAGFFGVCSPRGAQTAEAQLGLLASELAAVREQIDRAYFKQEGALQLLRDFIPESARKSSDEDRVRLRRVLVHAARQGASPDRGRMFFGLASRLSAEDVQVLRAMTRDDESLQSAAARALGGEAFGRERALPVPVTEPYALSRAVLEREGLVARSAERAGSSSAASIAPTALAREFLAWIGDEPRALPGEPA